MDRNCEVREMRIAETVLSIIRERGVVFSKAVTGELRETETLMRSLGEGRWKSANDGNSLAAYPTVWAVLRGCEG